MPWPNYAFFVSLIPSIIASMSYETNWDCETTSVHWNDETHRNLTSECGELKMSYDEQYCHVKNAKLWRCMVERAKMHDAKSCTCYTKMNIRDKYFCYYVEVCAFMDAKFDCSINYDCNISEDGRINCVAPGMEPYNNTCTKGLIFCPRDVCTDIFTVPNDLFKFYGDHCRSTYEQIFGKGKIVYFFEREHFNGTTGDYSKNASAILPLGVDHDPCNIDNSTKSSADWVLLFAVMAPLLLVLLGPICVWKIRRDRAKKNRRLKAILNNTSDILSTLLEKGGSRMEQTNETEREEVVDPITVDLSTVPNDSLRSRISAADTYNSSSTNSVSGNDVGKHGTNIVEISNCNSCDTTECPQLSEELRTSASVTDSSGPIMDYDINVTTYNHVGLVNSESCDDAKTDAWSQYDDHPDPRILGEVPEAGNITVPSMTSPTVYQNSTYDLPNSYSDYIPKSFELDS